MMRYILICLVVVPCMAGCATNSSEIRPIYPKISRSFGRIPRVDSLQPTFQWHGPTEGTTYDLAIWDAIWVSGQAGYTVGHSPNSDYKVGTQIYLREGLTGTSHRVAIALLPSKPYFWSFRPSGSEQWLTFSNMAGSGFKFLFETPLATMD